MCVDYTCLLHLVTIHLSCPKYLFTNLGDVTTVASFLSDPIKIDISVKLEKHNLWAVWDNCAYERRHWLQWRSIPQACLPWAPLTVLVPSFWTYQVTYFRTVKTLGVSLPGSGSDIFSRHFMELVCAGLSKNPYMSSAKKVSTITWFQEYFEREENKEILVHAGYWQEKQAKSAS